MQNMRAKPNLARRYALILGLPCLLLWLALGTSPDAGRPDRTTDGVSQLPGQNFVSNGGFENDFNGWTTVGDVVTSGNTHSGAKAFLSSDPDTTRFSYVWQELNFGYDTTEVTVWVYPEDAPYRSHFGLINGWRTPEEVYVTLVSFRHNAMIFSVPGANESFANVLVPNAWNKVVIQVNSATLTQNLYINDTLVSSLTATSFPTLEHLLVGDLSRLADFGTVLYDDISITGTIVSPELIAVDDQYVDSGTQSKFFPVLRNDLIPGGVTVEISIDTPPQHGQIVSIEPDGIWYQKDEGYEGTDQFSYILTPLGQNNAKNGNNTSVGYLLLLAFQCACCIDSGDTCPDIARARCQETQVQQKSRARDPVQILLRAGQAAVADSLDLDLLFRWRDDVLLATEAGTALFDTLMFNSPEILQLVLFEQPELRDQIFTLFAMVQGPARSLLEGDGSEVITQDQMDAAETFFANLSAGASDELRQILQEHVTALGPFDQYVGLTVQEAFALYTNPTGTAIDDEAPAAPTDFVLAQNFPNPFEETTEIRYTLTRPTTVMLAVYDLQGRRVRTLVQRQQGQGMQSVRWDGRGDSGVLVPSGVYFMVLTTPTHQQAKKMIVMK